MQFRIVFMGSPDFAVPTLRALSQTFDVTGVVTQPDRPAGRGRKLTPPPVKALASELALPVIQPGRLSEPAAMEQLEKWAPDVIVVAAFGQILRPAVLELPPHGCVNVHASLLPRWRGAAPIQAAMLAGDRETGITIMQMDAGLDTGPILSQQATPITHEDTAASLSNRLAEIGADLLVATLPSYMDGSLAAQPQDDSLATYAPKLEKNLGELDFKHSAEQLALLVRACHPWPGAYTQWQGQPLKILGAHAVGDTHTAHKPPGTPLVIDGLPAFATSRGSLVLDRVQPAGKGPMSGSSFLHGARSWSSSHQLST
jgi:methionyl-tRNA formyltransferase